MAAIVRNIKNLGVFEYHHEALEHIKKPGDVCVVHRGCARSFVMSCPDGCGDILTINLDPRSGKAWRLYTRNDQTTLFPSVWRDTGCEAHFIVWRDHIDWLDESWWSPSNKLMKSTLSKLSPTVSRSFTEIADDINEIPWDVSEACKALVVKGLAKRDIQQKGNYFLTEIKSSA